MQTHLQELMPLPFELPQNREFDAAGFGTNAVDHLIGLSAFPAFGGKAEVDSYAVEPGGEAASTMFGLTRLGLKSAYAGSFGDDAAGKIGLESLRDAGVNVDFSRTVESASTQSGFILVDADSGERTVLWQRDAKLSYAPEDAPVELASRCRVLHMTPHDSAACIEMAKAAKSAGTVVSLDVDKVFGGLDQLLPLVDICIASEDLPSLLTGDGDRERSLRLMNEKYGCALVGVTLGSRGSLILAAGELIETPAMRVPGGCKDTTGAGDAFRTGFLYGVLTGRDVRASASLANAVASLKCRMPGARRGLPDAAELQTMLKTSRL